jgi:uncharacterized metal-binding protein YceD (DUF177 family)
MKIHVLQIPADGLHVEGEIPAYTLDFEDEAIRPCSPVRYSLDVGLSKGGLFATGVLESDFTMECVDCLEMFTYTLRIDPFACQVELSGREMVDLTPYAREDILLALPPHPHCDWNAARQCKGVKQDPVQGAQEPSHAWDALNQLKIKPNN